MKWLYYILVACLLVMLATALAGYLRIRRHRNMSMKSEQGKPE
jgi:hypothetical protein